MNRISQTTLSKTTLLTLAAALSGPSAWAGNDQMKEQLLPGSTVAVLRCNAPCACAMGAFTSPTDGVFTITLVPTQSIPGIQLYDVENVCWSAPGFPFGGRITGAGRYTLNTVGPVALNRIELVLTLPNGLTLPFDSGLMPVLGPGFPSIDITAQSPQYICDVYSFRIKTAESCKSDLNGDARVNTADLVFLLAQYGQTARADECSANVNRDPGVDTTDLVALLGEFGRTCP